MTITNSVLFSLGCVCVRAFSSFDAKDPPEIIQKPRDVAVRSGGVAAFYCRARGEPTPTISWRKNGRKVNRFSIYLLDNFFVVTVFYCRRSVVILSDWASCSVRLDLGFRVDSRVDFQFSLQIK